MSREVRRVPVDWKHPVEPNPHWQFQRSTPFGRTRPASRLHGPTEQFVGLVCDYPGAIERWEQEGRDLAARAGHSWEFSVEWNLTGYNDCSCHPGQTGVIHPAYEWVDDNTEVPVVVRDEDHLHEVLTRQHESERPNPSDYMPVFDLPESELGWCLYETVSEGTPTTPVFATPGELVEHLATIGQDWDQVPMRRAAAETLVRNGGSFGSMVIADGVLYQADTDADLLEAAVAQTTVTEVR